MKIAKFVFGAILAQGITLGIVVLLIGLIPIRGTELTMIIAPLATVMVLGLTYLAGAWALEDGNKEKGNNESGNLRPGQH